MNHAITFSLLASFFLIACSGVSRSATTGDPLITETCTVITSCTGQSMGACEQSGRAARNALAATCQAKYDTDLICMRDTGSCYNRTYDARGCATGAGQTKPGEDCK